MADARKDGIAAWQLWVTIAGMALTVILAGGAGVWWLGTVSSRVNTLSLTSDTHTRQIAEMRTAQQRFDVELAQLKSQQIETETQFCASDIVRNLMHANDLREIAMLHSAVFHTTYPTDNSYYPVICRRDVGADR